MEIEQGDIGEVTADAVERAVAVAWMEDFQRQVYESLDIDFRNAIRSADVESVLSSPNMVKSHMEKLQETLGIYSESNDEKMIAQLAKARAAAPTKFEEPYWYHLMSRMASDIEGKLVESGKHLPVKPLFGTIPTGRVNGLAVAVPDTNYRVILLEDGLFGFANLMCKCISMVFMKHGESKDGMVAVSTDEKDVKRALESNIEVPRRFFDALCAYLIGGHPHLAEPYIASREAMFIGSVMRDSMETFVLAHEYGHIVGGHLGPAVGQKSIIGDLSIETIPVDWQHEFEADIIGLEAMLAVQMERGFDLALSFWGADAFFGCVDVIEKAVSVLMHGEERPWVADTHPPTADRRMMLRYVLSNSLKGTHDSELESALGLASVVENVIESLWNAVRPQFLQMHANGIRPSAGWMATG